MWFLIFIAPFFNLSITKYANVTRVFFYKYNIVDIVFDTLKISFKSFLNTYTSYESISIEQSSENII